MNWSDVGKVAASAAPLLGGLLGGPAGAAIGGIVATIFGADPNDPDAVAAAIKADPESAVKLARIEAEHQQRLIELDIEARRLELQTETARLAEVNKTMRREVASSDGYVRRMRPTAGYAAILIMIMITTAICYVMLYAPEAAGAVSQMLNAFALPLGGLLSIVGITAYRRSTEKLVDAGVVPDGGLIGDLLRKVRQ